MSGSGPGGITVLPIRGLPEINPGDDLGAALFEALSASARAGGRWPWQRGANARLLDGDVVVVTQKIVSKAEGRLVDLSEVEPSPFARAWAEKWQKDPRQVEVVLRESQRVVRMDQGIIIAETRHGFVCANAGVDASNVAPDRVALLPLDPDGSAERLRAALVERSGQQVGVVISDTFGRAWRLGQINVAIGCAGVSPMRGFAGQLDPAGYELRVTEIAVADELASAAELVMGKLDRVPAAIVRGVRYALGEGSSRALVLPPERDLFR